MHIYRVTYQIDIDTDTPSPHQAVVNALRHLQNKGATLEVEDPDTDTITEVNVAPLNTSEGKALDAIHEALDGLEWGPNTLDHIAEIVRGTGRAIREPDED